jgi:hypothetical protein
MRTRARLNVRARPDASSRENVIAVLPKDAVVEVEAVSSLWGKIGLQVVGTTTVGAGFVALEWLQSGWLDPGPYRIGLGVHCMTNAGAAWESARAGAPAIVLMDGFGANGNAAEAIAIKRAHPGCTVIYRHFWPHGHVPSEEQIVAALPRYPGLLYSIFNEGDTFGMDVGSLRARARAEVALARTLRAAGDYGKVLVGGFAMLNPDWRDPGVRAVFRDEYAPSYNLELVGFDQHTYTPTMEGGLDLDGAGNWRQLFSDDIGFDPAIRAVVSTETGLDEPYAPEMGWLGRGGFAAFDVGVEGFRGWCARFADYQSAPLRNRRSPMIAACMFQYGGNGDPQWERHNLVRYLPALREFWK